MTFYVFLLTFNSIYCKPCQDNLCCNFLYIEHLSHSLSWTPPPERYRPSHLIKFTLKTGINDDDKAQILDDYDDGMDIEDIVNDVGIENVLKYNMRLRYRLRKGDKIYIGTQIKGKNIGLYFGVFMNL